eukprot:m.185778 g.185778  ORF g.185778 m.185778 type:complete len:253 (+) comp39337_c0_seq44:819-1577(+)
MAKMDAPIQSKEETPDGEKQSGLADPEATVEQAGKFIKAAIDAEQEKRKGLNRGPFLIPFELVKLARARMPQLSGKFGLPSLVDLVVTYFDHFGDRRACHSDVDPYLCLLSDNEKRELVLRVRLFVAAVEREGREKDDLSDGVALKIMQRHIFSVQLARSLGEHEKLSVEEKMDLVKEMKERLSNGQKYRIWREMVCAFSPTHAHPQVLAFWRLMSVLWTHTLSWLCMFLLISMRRLVRTFTSGRASTFWRT